MKKTNLQITAVLRPVNTVHKVYFKEKFAISGLPTYGRTSCRWSKQTQDMLVRSRFYKQCRRTLSGKTILDWYCNLWVILKFNALENPVRSFKAFY